MIDEERLAEAYEKRGFYALQLEVGDECHQGCIYCYMNALDSPTNTLSGDLIGEIIEDAHRLSITAIEWLGGEPLLRDSIFEHMERSASLGIRNNVWTGGLPLADKKIMKRTADLARNGLIAVHISTVDADVYRLLHPGRPAEDLELLLEGVQALLDYGYPASRILNSVTFTGLQAAEDMIRTIDHFEEKLGVRTTLNIYHTYLRPGIERDELTRFIPRHSEVEKVYERYSAQWGVERFPMNCVNKQYCSATLAVLCNGKVTPCATIRDDEAPDIHAGGSLCDIVEQHRSYLVFDHFRVKENLPRACRECDLSSECFGCRSRSYAAGKGFYGKDPRCFGRVEFGPRSRLTE